MDIHAIEFHPDNMGTYYLATDGGVYKTTDDGGTFTPMNEGLTTTQFYNRISNSANDTSLILGGTQDNGTLLYSGKPDWTQVLEGDGSWSVISEDTAAIMVYQYEEPDRTISGERGRVLFALNQFGAIRRDDFFSAHDIEPAVRLHDARHPGAFRSKRDVYRRERVV